MQRQYWGYSQHYRKVTQNGDNGLPASQLLLGTQLRYVNFSFDI
jgi:hypothetical protein